MHDLSPCLFCASWGASGDARHAGITLISSFGKSLKDRISFHSKQAYHDDKKTEIELKFLNVNVLLNKHS
jgi:hypothetical protein